MEAYKLDQYFEASFTLSRADTGAASDADSTPTYRVYEENNETAVATGNCAKRDDSNTLGLYYARAQVTTAAGFEVGKSYVVYVDATVNSVAGSQVVGRFRVLPVEVWDTLYGGTDSLTVDLNSGQSVASVTGAVGSVTGNVGGNVVGSVASVTSGVTVSANNDKTGYSLSGTKTTLDALNDVSSANVQSATAAALTAYDAATGTDVTSTIDTLNDLSSADVQSAVTASLNAYDPPTRAELTTDTNSVLTRLGTPAGADIAADIATVDAVADGIKTQTDQFVFTTPNKVDASADVTLTEQNIQDIADAVNAGAGTGDHQWNYPVTYDGNPVDNARVYVWLNSDRSGSPAYRNTTISDGIARFNVDLAEGTRVYIRVETDLYGTHLDEEEIVWA